MWRPRGEGGVEYVHAKRHSSVVYITTCCSCFAAVVCFAVLFLLLLPALRCRCCCCCLLLLFFVVVGVLAVLSSLSFVFVGVCPKGLPPRGFLVGVCLE